MNLPPLSLTVKETLVKEKRKKVNFPMNKNFKKKANRYFREMLKRVI